MHPLDSASNSNMVSGVTDDHGQFNFGKKDELFIVLWAVDFVSVGEGAELLTSSPLKLSLDLLQQIFLISRE